MKKFFSFLLFISMTFSTTFAHRGRTDGSGGHYNRSTGEYHYHHGYSEHQHTNDMCPYDYNYKTNSNSSNNASGTIKDADTNSFDWEDFLFILWLFIFFGLPLLSAIREFVNEKYSKIKNKPFEIHININEIIENFEKYENEDDLNK